MWSEQKLNNVVGTPVCGTQANWKVALSQRCRGPGGYYNIGNLIGLTSGLCLQILSSRTSEGEQTGFSNAVVTYLIGSPGAIALTCAMLVFFLAGELYHRAWQGLEAEPDTRLNRWADFTSGIGALLLAVSLTYFGNIWLAITSTVLLAGGKFGSSVVAERGWPVRIEFKMQRATTGSMTFDGFRAAVVLSRVPAILSLASVLVATTFSHADFGLGETQSAILLLCFTIWTRADILLARSAPETPIEAKVQ